MRNVVFGRVSDDPLSCGIFPYINVPESVERSNDDCALACGVSVTPVRLAMLRILLFTEVQFKLHRDAHAWDCRESER